MAYAFLEKINSHLSRAAVLKTKAIGTDRIEAKAILQPGVIEKPYQCLNRLGTLESLAKIFTNKFATIEHPVCIHKGGDCCQYIITWEKTRSFLWKKIRSYSLVIGFLICLLSLSILSPAHWGKLVLLYLVMVMGVTLYTEHLEKEELFAKGTGIATTPASFGFTYNNFIGLDQWNDSTFNGLSTVKTKSDTSGWESSMVVRR